MISCLFCDEWKGTAWLGGDAGYICRRHLIAFLTGWASLSASGSRPNG